MTTDRKKQGYTAPRMEWIALSRKDILEGSPGVDNDENQGPWSEVSNALKIGLDL